MPKVIGFLMLMWQSWVELLALALAHHPPPQPYYCWRHLENEPQGVGGQLSLALSVSLSLLLCLPAIQINKFKIPFNVL